MALRPEEKYRLMSASGQTVPLFPGSIGPLRCTYFYLLNRPAVLQDAGLSLGGPRQPSSLSPLPFVPLSVAAAIPSGWFLFSFRSIMPAPFYGAGHAITRIYPGRNPAHAIAGGRQRKEILQLQRAGISTASAELLLARMHTKIDALCAERERLKKEEAGAVKGRVLGGRSW